MQSSEDIWVKVDVDPRLIRIEYVGDRALLPQVLADLPQLQSGFHEADAIAIERERSVSTGAIASANAKKEMTISQHRLMFCCTVACVVLAIAVVFSSCSRRGNDQNSFRIGDRSVVSLDGGDRWMDGAGRG